MDTMHEARVDKAPHVDWTLVSSTANTYGQLVKGAAEAMFAWQHDVLKFANMRLAANMKLVNDVAEAKDARTLATILAEHVSHLYEHISTTAIGYSQRMQDILQGGSKEIPNGPPSTAHEYAKQSSGSKRQNVHA